MATDDEMYNGMPDSLKKHLDDMANSVAYFFDALLERDVEPPLAGELTNTWLDQKLVTLREERR